MNDADEQDDIAAWAAMEAVIKRFRAGQAELRARLDRGGTDKPDHMDIAGGHRDEKA